MYWRDGTSVHETPLLDSVDQSRPMCPPGVGVGGGGDGLIMVGVNCVYSTTSGVKKSNDMRHKYMNFTQTLQKVEYKNKYNFFSPLNLLGVTCL